MRQLLSAFLIGGIFGLGIAIAGMANPAKVLNFFDIAGTWDPSLIFVMGGALVTTFIGYRLTFKRRDNPLQAQSFSLPVNTRIDARLIGGAAIFGTGWGIAGFCPGGAIPALGLGYASVWIFIAAVITGIAGTRLVEGRAR